MKYHQAQDGEWIVPEMTGYREACCDCGLVHRINFAILHSKTLKPIKGAIIAFQAIRDNRATGQKRRKRK